MTAQQQGGSSSFTRWLPQNEGLGKCLSVCLQQSDKQEKWVKRQNQVTGYCMSVSEKQPKIFFSPDFFLIRKEYVSTFSGVYAQ